MKSINLQGIKIKEAPVDAIPNCPYCKKELHEIWIKTKGLGFIEKKQLLMCPECKAYLGYGSFSWS